MARLPIGQRIVARRREQGLTQKELARAAGISASYLNLIEHDRRQIGGALLQRIAAALDSDTGHLSGSDDARLAGELLDIARQSATAGAGLDEAGALDLVARQPQWAQAFVRLHRAWREARETSVALSDRVSQDPALVELSHAVLTGVTAIRSFAEILEEHADLAPQERHRFSGIIASQSARLGSNAREMIALLGGSDAAAKPTTPAEEVDDFIIFHGNHFADLESAANGLRGELAEGDLASTIAQRLRGHGVSLSLEDGLPRATLRFRLARRLAERELAGLIDEHLLDERLTGEEARALARGALASYAAGALLLPYDAFREAAEGLRYDIERLALRFDASFEQAAHRLVTLRRPGAEGIPFAYLRSDGAGNLSKPFGIAGLRMPRFGSACPLWALYEAFTSPERTITQIAEFPDGERFLFVARRLVKGTPEHGGIAPVFSVMLGCDAVYMDRTVYGDAHPRTTPVGPSCRSCPRPACPQRAHASLLAPQRGTGSGQAGAHRG